MREESGEVLERERGEFREDESGGGKHWGNAGDGGGRKLLQRGGKGKKEGLESMERGRGVGKVFSGKVAGNARQEVSTAVKFSRRVGPKNGR